MTKRGIPVASVDLQSGGFKDGYKSKRSQTSNCVKIYHTGIGQFTGEKAIGDTKDPDTLLVVGAATLKNFVEFTKTFPRNPIYPPLIAHEQSHDAVEAIIAPDSRQALQTAA